MPKYTKNLNLYEFDPQSDDPTTTAFNTKTFISDNLDKIDANAGEVSEKIADLTPMSGNTDPTAATVGEFGQQYINTKTAKTFTCLGDIGGMYTWRCDTYIKSTNEQALTGENDDTYMTPFLVAKAIVSKILGKVDKEDGMGLSARSYTEAEQTKLAGIEVGANAYTLPTASASVLGGVKLGANIARSNGTISVPDGDTETKGVVFLSDIVGNSSSNAATPAGVQAAINAKLVDYIVETGAWGESGRYIKWSSGRFEAQGCITVKITETRALGSLRETIAFETAELPFNVLRHETFIMCNDLAAVGYEVSFVNNRILRFSLCGPIDADGDYDVCINVTGTW